ARQARRHRWHSARARTGALLRCLEAALFRARGLGDDLPTGADGQGSGGAVYGVDRTATVPRGSGPIGAHRLLRYLRAHDGRSLSDTFRRSHALPLPAAVYRRASRMITRRPVSRALVVGVVCVL